MRWYRYYRDYLSKYKLINLIDYNLTLDDLHQFPAWTYALDEEGVKSQDERTVRPYLVPPPLDVNAAYYLVRASFIFADGSNYQGFIKPKPIDRVDQDDFLSIIIPYDLSPVIVFGKDQIHFQYGPEKPDRIELKRVYDLYS